jgi:hypothetical protein
MLATGVLPQCTTTDQMHKNKDAVALLALTVDAIP